MYKLAEIQVTYSTEINPKVKISTAEDAYKVFKESWDMNTIELFEEFKILCLNRSNHVLGIYVHSKGGISGTVVDHRLIFAIALKCNASSIILCHNHPSGNLTPSSSDNKITKKIKECGDMLDIILTDHIIITKDNYKSMAFLGMV